MAPYQSFKLFLTELAGISKDGFHIILGFLVFLAVARFFSWRLSSWKTFLAPLLFAVALELMDARDSKAYGFSVNIDDSIKDIVVTTLLPFLTIVYSRYISRRV